MTGKDKEGYKIVGAATWELIRAAYLSGDSARALAERFGVSEHAIRKRITVEKWTKRDYAAALEARGLPPPPKKESLTIAARFAANYQPPPAPPEPQHPLAELVDARKQAKAAAESERPSAPLHFDGDPQDAAELERRALAQAAAAMAKGRAADAKTFAGLAEQMRKRAEDERESERAAEDKVNIDAAAREEFVRDMFGKAAYLAAALAHDPGSGPARFLQLIKRWREINLGEGEEDAEKAAAKVAAAHRHYVDGSWIETTPEDVRAYLAARWRDTLKRLDETPV